MVLTMMRSSTVLIYIFARPRQILEAPTSVRPDDIRLYIADEILLRHPMSVS